MLFRSKFSTLVVPAESAEEIVPKEQKVKKSKKKGKKLSKKGKIGPSLAKDLNLRPTGKKTFEQFAQEKKPSSNQEKCLIAAYYLKHTLKRKVDINSVYTCFKFVHWRVPANLLNTLCVLSNQKGWLNTTKLADMEITTLGENQVEHDLPVKTKGKQ